MSNKTQTQAPTASGEKEYFWEYVVENGWKKVDQSAFGCAQHSKAPTQKLVEIHNNRVLSAWLVLIEKSL